MFASFSLCPGGAFIMCESVAEFDPNAPDPVALDLVTEPDGEAAKVVVKEQLSCDPVAKLMGKLAPTYDKILNINENQPDLADNEAIIAHLNYLGTVANEIADLIRMMLVKQKAARSLCNYEGGCDWVHSDLKAHLGTFIKAGPLLKQHGYDSTSYSYSVIPCLTDSYSIVKMITAYIGTADGLPDSPFDIEELRSILAAYGPYLDAFANTHDLFNCLFNDPDRCARLEADVNETIHISNLIMECTPKINAPVACFDQDADAYCHALKYVACVLRQVKKAIYKVQCDVMDGKPADAICINKITSGICNMFYVPAILMFSAAYGMRGAVARREAVSSYVANTLEALKGLGIR